MLTQSNSNSGEEGSTPEAWMDEASIRRTQEVWSKRYGRPIARNEALEIMGNVKWLAKTLMKEVLRREGK